MSCGAGSAQRGAGGGGQQASLTVFARVLGKGRWMVHAGGSRAACVAFCVSSLNNGRASFMQYTLGDTPAC